MRARQGQTPQTMRGRRRRLSAAAAPALPAALQLLAPLALALLLVGGAAGQEAPPTEVEALAVEAAARCRVKFNATGFPKAVSFLDPERTEAFTDRPTRLAGTARARAFAEDFATAFAGDPSNVAITGWRKKRRGGWKRAHTVVTVTTVVWDAAAKVLRYDVEQFPGQAAVTKGFRSGAGAGEAGGAEALRFCSGFVDGTGQNELFEFGFDSSGSQWTGSPRQLIQSNHP